MMSVHGSPKGSSVVQVAQFVNEDPKYCIVWYFVIRRILHKGLNAVTAYAHEYRGLNISQKSSKTNDNVSDMSKSYRYDRQISISESATDMRSSLNRS